MNETTGLARRTDPDTSHEAAAVVNVNKLERIILDHLLARPVDGLTTTEIAVASKTPRDSLSPRMKGLVDLKLIEDSEERRVPVVPADGRRHPKQIVWKITAAGMELVLK